MNNVLPEIISSEAELEEVMTRPTQALLDSIKDVDSPLVLLGAAGKMGPTMAIMAKRAADAAGKNLDVIAVSRFSNEAVMQKLQVHGVIPLRYDLMDADHLNTLPDTTNLIHLVGMKFGTSDNPGRTWAFNTLIPANVCKRYPHARIAALSTGNVYPLVKVDSGGAEEQMDLIPMGEYANSCVARERIFQFFAETNGMPLVLIRLNYAIDLRYGVLVDIAQKIDSGKPIDLSMGYLNCIWQGDANEMIVRSLGTASHPPLALNLTSSEIYSVRQIAFRLGELMGKEVLLTGNESETALLSNTTRMVNLLGKPGTALETMLKWTAQWVSSVGIFLNKPTHFEVRDGKF